MKIIIKNKHAKEIDCKEGQTLLEALQEAGEYIPALCAGRGTCGKCKVQISVGEVCSSEEASERKKDVGWTQGKLSMEEGTQGVMLACKTCALTDVVLELSEDGEENMVVEVAEGRQKKDEPKEQKKQANVGETFGSPKISDLSTGQTSFVALDIGTTTIAMALVEESTGKIIDTYAALNRQRMYGADVISRIAAANNGALPELKCLIAEDLEKGIRKLSQEGNRPIEKVIIAANTTMVHLLMGYSCESLGRHPFFSEYLGLIETSLGEVLDREAIVSERSEKVPREPLAWLFDVPVIILPGISAFVGSDITADLLICPGFEEEGVSLLLDMGTNGEMVIGNKDRLVAASTAAGPAFEGGNITCGTGSIPGAINQVKMMNRRAIIGTIGSKQPPAGICGTGIIEAIAQLKQNRLINKEGALQPPYGDSGYPLWTGAKGEKIAIYQQDIRQLQLAKGAIRAGMEQLMEAFDCKPEEVDRVYLAGGFGTQLPINGAVEIGLFPEEFKGKIIPIGNGALQGAIAYGRVTGGDNTVSREKDREESVLLKAKKKQLEEIKGRAESLNLALAEGFEERYLKYLNF